MHYFRIKLNFAYRLYARYWVTESNQLCAYKAYINHRVISDAPRVSLLNKCSPLPCSGFDYPQSNFVIESLMLFGCPKTCIQPRAHKSIYPHQPPANMWSEYCTGRFVGGSSKERFLKLLLFGYWTEGNLRIVYWTSKFSVSKREKYGYAILIAITIQ